MACGAFVVAAFAAAASPAAADGGSLLGRVLSATSPLAEARVYAYQLAEHTLRKVLTDETGRFLFQDLPVGVYKIVAHKAGYDPSVTVLERHAPDKDQFVEVELHRMEAKNLDDTSDDFWALRAQVPPDVLRQIVLDAPPAVALVAPSQSSQAARFLTQMQAMSGLQELENQSMARVSGGQVGVEGRVRGMRVSVEGDYRLLDSGLRDTTQVTGVQGQAAALRVDLESPDHGRIDVATYSNRLLARFDDGTLPLDFSRYEVQYKKPIDEQSATAFSAQYVSQNGLYSLGWAEPEVLPIASRTVRIEGSYSREIGDDINLRSGVRYREASGDYAGYSYAANYPGQRYVDAYTLGDWQAQPGWILKYGMYSTVADGSAALTPRTGLTVELGQDWLGDATVSRRVSVHGVDSAFHDFLPSRYEDILACEDSERSCYELQFSHGRDTKAPQFVVGGSYREFDRTVRMFFSENFLDENESIFLVPGDKIPEAHASIRHRVAPRVTTQWKAEVARGGGGLFRAANRRAYENQISYLSTSFDTEFESTSTAVAVTYSRVAQELRPLALDNRRFVLPQSELQRLEFAVSQNLAALFNSGSEWAVHVALELTRGATLLQNEPLPEEIRTRFLTGLAVRF